MRSLLLFLLHVIAVQADLTCLTWGLFSLPLGLFCHFKHDTFNAVENATVNAVKQIAEDVKDAVKFKVESHPVVLGYDWLSTAISNGTSAANEQYRSHLVQEYNVEIGFGKELANTAVQIYELTHWNDLVNCLIIGSALRAGKTLGGLVDSGVSPSGFVTVVGTTTGIPRAAVTPIATSKRKRYTQLSLDDSRSVLAECSTEKFKRIANPAVFNITGPDEKIGATLFQLATFFVPVGAEVEVGTKVAKSFDLIIPGAEDAGIIFEDVAGQAQHFKSEGDALAVQSKLSDESWVNTNCKTTPAPPGALGKRSDPARAERRAVLGIRGNVLSWACIKPPALAVPESFDVPDPYGAAQQVPDQRPLPYYDPRFYRDVIAEELVSPAPSLSTWGDAAKDSANILRDLETQQTAALAWSPKLSEAVSSKDLFKLLRQIFAQTDDVGRALADQLYVGETNERRWAFKSIEIPKGPPSTDPNMLKLQKFRDAAVQQGIDAAKSLANPSERAGWELMGDIDFYYIEKGEEAIKNPDPRGMHKDQSILQLGAADQPGLVIANRDKLFRVPILDNGWHLMKCVDWGGSRASLATATEHTVFGPEIVQNGRVSIIVNIYEAVGTASF